MRVTRDQRGYETTYLLHTPRPGERPRILYWYRTAPGVRVGRRPLDEEAIRTIEEQHPEIDFDWPTLLEEAESIEPEVLERRPEKPRRKKAETFAPAGLPAGAAAPMTSAATARPSEAPRPAASAAEADLSPRRVQPARSAPAPAGLLDQLVGREIASRLRARYAEVTARLLELPDDQQRTAWQQRADALDPDRWDTPEAILEGIRHADRSFDELKRELPGGE